VYNLKHNSAPINEYYPRMRGVWEELSVVNDLLRFIIVKDNITNFFQALAKENEAETLSVLDGLDETYSSRRSHIPLMSPLPFVEFVGFMIHQE